VIDILFKTSLLFLSLMAGGLMSCQSSGSEGGLPKSKINLRAKNNISTYFDILHKDEKSGLASALIKEQDPRRGWISYDYAIPMPKLFITPKKSMGMMRQFGEMHLFRGYESDFILQIDFKCGLACEQSLTVREFSYEGSYQIKTLADMLSADTQAVLNEDYKKCLATAAQVSSPMASTCPQWFRLSREADQIILFTVKTLSLKSGDKIKQKFILSWDKKVFSIAVADKSEVWTEKLP
jgi:hypothetical protein